MKIRFQKFEPTGTFIKLFGLKHDASGSGKGNETDAVYEYYYKRGNTYYFRNSAGEKITVDYDEPQQELVRGNKYTIDAINNRNS